MLGALIHITVGLISALIVHKFHQKLEFSLAIFLGNLLPDVLKILSLAMYHNSLNVALLIQSSYHPFTHSLVNGFNFTFMFFLFWIVLGWLLYHFHFVRKKKFTEWEELVIFLLVGYVTHLTFDAFEWVFYLYLPTIPIWL